MIRTNGLSHAYDPTNVLNFRDWEINFNDQWLLLGSSGSGKTTLIHILSGLLKPKNGDVFVDDTNLYRLTQNKLDRFRGQRIGLVFQRPHLIKSLSIKDNLKIAQSFAGLSVNSNRIVEVLETLGILSKVNNYPHQLSHGQLQRVSIARAVINKPALIVADEPTSSLDDENTRLVLDLLITQSVLNNSALIISTHDKRVKDMFDKQYLL